MKKHFLLILTTIAFFTACNKEVTDELTNPAEINVIYELIKGIDNDGSISQYTRAMVFSDQYYMYDPIKDGGITINGKELPYNSQTKTYYTEDEILYGTEYTFELTLSDGKKYSSSVTTPESLFNGVVTFPAVYSTSGNLIVEWSDTIEDGVISFEFYGRAFNDDETELIYSNEEVADDGSFTFSPDLLPSQYQGTEIDDVYIKLSRLIEGTKCEAFNTEDIYVLFSYISGIETE